MISPTPYRDNERSRWLASLSAALAEALGVLAALDEDAAQSVEAHHLKGRIAAIRSEVEQLRRGGFPSLQEVGRRPRWPGWNR
jgi:hypothetical protein